MSLELDQKKSDDVAPTSPQTDLEAAPGKSSAAQSMDGPGGVRESGIVPSTSGGAALPDGLQSRFGSSLGKDLSGVRVHTGAESNAAASSVNARAFAVGNDIHFGAGQYDPQSEGGQRLLAHEVAHTVQQDGQKPSPQMKLNTTQPGDAHETEADHAADSMIAGKSANVSAKSGPTIARDKVKAPAKEDDKAWALRLRLKVESVQEAAQVAQEALNADAAKAVGAGKQAQQSYNSFESAYNQAVTRFTTGVKKAMQQAEELRAAAKTVAAVALAAFGGEAGELIAKVGETYEKVAKAGEFVGALQEASAGASAKAAGKTPEAPKEKKAEGEKPNVSPGKTDATNWNQLLSTTLAAFDRYVKSTSNVSSINKTALKSHHYLTAVIEGTNKGDAQGSAEGQAAAKFADGADACVQQLGAIKPGMVSIEATKFASDVSTTLDKLDSKRIEQDIAIKWLSGLSRDEVGAISDAGSYLKKIGVIDTKDNYLGVDTGNWTTEWDTLVIRVRAQLDQRAKAMVGGMHKWEGGKLSGGTVIGSVHADEQTSQSWWASGPADLKEEAGGEVRVIGYTLGGIDKDVRSNWEHVNESQLETRMHSNVKLYVQPVDETKKKV